ncbi:MAG: hypothetical protein H0T46_12435 [Deltaproteobacteria bacterium]|nr:hypothetical protein [Deltaproteobacteria bacterium]
MEQPDELILHAWNGGIDRMSVIREGTDAARLLLAGERNELATLFWPVPRPLEAVSRWSGNSRPVAGVSEGLRPFASAVVPGCIVGALVAHFVVTPHVSELGAKTAMVLVIVATIVVVGVLLKVLIGARVKRQVARLDEEAALAIVVAALRAGMKRNPARISRACEWIRRGLQLPGVANQL